MLVADIFMEDLEQATMSSAPTGMKLKIWKRYINDSFKVVKKEKRDELTEHLNHMDSSPWGVSKSQTRWKSRAAFLS